MRTGIWSLGNAVSRDPELERAVMREMAGEDP